MQTGWCLRDGKYLTRVSSWGELIYASGLNIVGTPSGEVRSSASLDDDDHRGFGSRVVLTAAFSVPAVYISEFDSKRYKLAINSELVKTTLARPINTCP